MKKIFTSVLFVILSVCSSLSASEAPQQSQSPEAAVKRATEIVLSYFTPAEGKVTAAEGAKIFVQFPETAQIREGMRLSVFRQGNPFYHPVTNELIGHSEEFAGRIEITGQQGGDGLYPCFIVRGEPKVGDTARITGSRIKLAFFQERKSDWELSEAFYSALKGAGRFEIADAYTPSYKPEDLSQLAVKMNAEAVILFSTPYRDEERFLKVSLYWAEDTKPLAETEQLVSVGVSMTAPEEQFIVRSMSDTEPWGSYRLDSGQLFSIGDVDSNGVAELVVSDGNSISIYNFRDQLQEIWSIKGKAAETLISVDVLDLNGNGSAEIFVTALSDETGIKTDDRMPGFKRDGMTVRSFVLEFDPVSGYRKIKDDVPYFFRVTGKKLLMQKFDGSRVFSGPVYEGEWENGEYTAKKQLSLPDNANIYGFTFIDWQNKGQTQVMTFDDSGYLGLYDSKGQAIWKSSRSYGKFPLAFERTTYSIANPLNKWSVRGRLISLRVDQNEEVIVVSRTPVVEMVPGLGSRGAEVYALWWDGSEMQEKLVLSEVPGTVTDYWVQGSQLYILAKSDLMSLVKKAFSGELGRGSMLYYYKLGEK